MSWHPKCLWADRFTPTAAKGGQGYPTFFHCGQTGKKKSEGGFLKYYRQDTIKNNSKEAVFSMTVQLRGETKEKDCFVVLEKVGVILLATLILIKWKSLYASQISH